MGTDAKEPTEEEILAQQLAHLDEEGDKAANPGPELDAPENTDG